MEDKDSYTPKEVAEIVTKAIEAGIKKASADFYENRGGDGEPIYIGLREEAQNLIRQFPKNISDLL